MSDKSEQELVAAAQGGDQAALTELIERHQAQIYRFGMKLCRAPEDAEDVLQETLIALARSIRDLRGTASISTWLYAVARSYCIKKRRRSKFAPKTVESLSAPGAASDVADPGRTPDAALEGKQIELAVSNAIQELEPMYRDILVLRDVEGLSALEVAEVTGLKVAAVKSRLHRARIRVRNSVAPVLGLDPNETGETKMCRNLLKIFSKHVENEIKPEVCAEMEHHLETCERCRTACDSLRKTLATCRATPTVEVPEAIQKLIRVKIRGVLDAAE
ncbi:MAG: sigma-70 family RNA polymerase sigma factor [Deltaproteobacteria bacterium]|nr:sigma-70 family RNA polymerase sigma factor [Deltaproteobacteria bacterium]